MPPFFKVYFLHRPIKPNNVYHGRVLCSALPTTEEEPFFRRMRRHHRTQITVDAYNCLGLAGERIGRDHESCIVILDHMIEPIRINDAPIARANKLSI